MPAIELAVAGAIISPIIKGLIEGGGKALKSCFENWNSSISSEEICQRILRFGTIKTIWSSDEAVSITDFYYPSKINGKTIDSLARLGGRNKVIEGIVGQGKSVFLRYLCVQELTPSGTGRIPIFIELRYISPDARLSDHIKDAIMALGLSYSESLFSYLAESKKIVLLLDGFDEIDRELVKRTVTEIEQLSKRFPDLQFVVTSRPRNEIQKSNLFQVSKLQKLESEDYLGFLNALQLDPKKSIDIIAAIAASDSEIVQLISTPLMLILVVIVYNNEAEIPSELPEFFERLFNAVFSRHDKLKAGFERKHLSGLSEKKLQSLFECFCAMVMQEYESSTLELEQFNYAFDRAVEIVPELNCDVDNFRHDITKVACLLLEDGFERLSFVHKSLLEYFSASFVKHSVVEVAEDFYQIASDDFHRWEDTLRFLARIDTYRYMNFYHVPNCRFILDEMKFGNSGASDSDLVKFAIEKFGSIRYTFAIDGVDENDEQIYSNQEFGPYDEQRRHYGIFYSEFIQAIELVIEEAVNSNYTLAQLKESPEIFFPDPGRARYYTNLSAVIENFGTASTVAAIRSLERDVYMSWVDGNQIIQAELSKMGAFRARKRIASIQGIRATPQK